MPCRPVRHIVKFFKDESGILDVKPEMDYSDHPLGNSLSYKSRQYCGESAIYCL